MRSLIRNNPSFRVLSESVRNFSVYCVDNQRFDLAINIEKMIGRVSNAASHPRNATIYEKLRKINTYMREKNKSLIQEYPVFVLSRDKDVNRYNILEKRCLSLGISITRVRAIDGLDPNLDFRHYSKYMPDSFWGSNSFKKGVIGCYLSHAKTWEHIVKNSIDFSIILENDAYPLVTFPRSIELFNFPKNFDVGFINRRAAGWFDCDFETLYNFDTLVYPMPYESGVKILVDQYGLIDAPGTESYAVSYMGAKKLLEMVESSKICCGDDWAISLHSLDKTFREYIIQRLSVEQRREISTLNISDIKLISFILIPGLVDHRDEGVSLIDHFNIANRIDKSMMNL